MNYFGDINGEKTFFINIEEVEKSVESNKESEFPEDNTINTSY